jgi:ADP-ribose pyrophosphatase
MNKFRECPVRSRRVRHGRAVDFRVDTVRLPNGKPVIREYLDHCGAAAVVPFIEDDIILVRQYRYPVGRTTYEIPAGKLDAGEGPLACIRRELREETGYTAGRIRRLIGFWPTPAFSNELIHVYVADRLKPGRMQLDHDEFLSVARVPFKKALRWVFAGKIRDSKTVIALLASAALRSDRAGR